MFRRCYGYNTDLLIDRGAEINNMVLLHKHGMGAELMATFNNGIAYEFLKGDTLDKESVVRPDTYPKVRILNSSWGVQQEVTT